MKLFLISQTHNTNYGTFDSAIVAALDAAQAKSTHPGDWDVGECGWDYGWAAPEHIHVKHIGTALEGTQAGVICASFN